MGKVFNNHLAVVDLETLGAVNDSVILSFGITVSKYTDSHLGFNELIKEGMYLKFDIKEQIAKGRKKQNRVVKWWYEQTAEAKQVLIPGPEDVSLYSLDERLTQFFASKNLKIRDVDFYDRKSFDMSKIQYLYEEDFNKDIPWNPVQEFEVATAFRFLGMDRYAGIQVKDIPGATYHNALHDAAVDHLRLFKALHSVQDES